MGGLVFKWAVNAGGVLLVSWLFDGIKVAGIGWAFIAAAFLAVFNVVLRPVLLLLTLPLNVLTLGLFTLVINALMLWLTGSLLKGFEVTGFWTAIGGALILSLISMAANVQKGPDGGVVIVRSARGPDGNRG